MAGLATPAAIVMTMAMTMVMTIMTFPTGVVTVPSARRLALTGCPLPLVLTQCSGNGRTSGRASG